MLIRPAYNPPGIPTENIVRRAPLRPGEKEAFFALARVIDLTNYKDVLGLLIKKFFTTDIAVTTVFDWLSEIARQSGNPEAVERVQWHHDHCLIKRRQSRRPRQSQGWRGRLASTINPEAVKQSLWGKLPACRMRQAGSLPHKCFTASQTP